MDDFDNTIGFSDDDQSDLEDDQQGSQSCKCKLCESVFSTGDKGCSALKELCPKCHANENADLLAAFENQDTVSEGKDINI